jgi:hypothetical protein
MVTRKHGGTSGLRVTDKLQKKRKYGGRSLPVRVLLIPVPSLYYVTELPETFSMVPSS